MAPSKPPGRFPRPFKYRGVRSEKMTMFPKWAARNPALAHELHYVLGTRSAGVSIEIWEKSLVVTTLWEDGTTSVEEFGEK